MSCNLIAFSTPTLKVQERSSMAVTARFRDRAAADVTPTNVSYRLDSAEGNWGNCELLGWTSGTPGTTLAITITPEQNRILNDARALETRYLTVASDKGLSTEYRETLRYQVRNEAYAD